MSCRITARARTVTVETLAGRESLVVSWRVHLGGVPAHCSEGPGRCVRRAGDGAVAGETSVLPRNVVFKAVVRRAHRCGCTAGQVAPRLALAVLGAVTVMAGALNGVAVEYGAWWQTVASVLARAAQSLTQAPVDLTQVGGRRAPVPVRALVPWGRRVEAVGGALVGAIQRRGQRRRPMGRRRPRRRRGAGLAAHPAQVVASPGPGRPIDPRRRVAPASPAVSKRWRAPSIFSI